MKKTRREIVKTGNPMADALAQSQADAEDFMGNGYEGLSDSQGYGFESQANSNMRNVKADPKLKEAQLAALQDLRDRSQNGMSLRDKADIANSQEDVAAQNRGRQEATCERACADPQPTPYLSIDFLCYVRSYSQMC